MLERFTTDDGGLRIDLVVQPAISYSLVSSQIPLVRRLSVSNIGDEPIAGLRLTVNLTAASGAIAPPWTVTLPEPLPPESTVDWEAFGAFTPSVAQLRDTDEAFGVDYRVVAAGSNRPTLRLAVPSTVLAHHEWFNSPALYPALAAFVQPATHAADTVLRAAAGVLLNRTGSSALQGYQAGPHRAAQIAGAIYEGLRSLGLRAQPTRAATFENAAHPIRRTSAVLNRRAGTCFDLSVAYAAACAAAGLRPLIWVAREHAFAGFLVEERHLGEIVVTEPNTLVSMVNSGLAVPVDLARIGAGENAADFAAAVETGLAHFRTIEVFGAVDVHLAHRSGIQPMPSHDRPPSEEMPTSIITPVIQTSEEDAGRIELPDGAASAKLRQRAEDGDEAPPAPDDAPLRIQRWKKSLLDLSLRNPLLNLPSGGKGVDLRVPPGALATLDDLIHDGTPLSLIPWDEEARALDPEALTGQLAAARRVYTAASRQRYISTMRALQRDARTMQQETGGNYLYLTLGTLVHPKSTGDEANAPLFLLPVRIEGGVGGGAYHLVIDGAETAAPNHCLIEWLRVRHGVRIPQLENPTRDDHGIDIPKALAAISADLVTHQLSYRVDERASLRLLHYSTFQLWRDLTDHWQIFMDNPVVRHLVTTTGGGFDDPAGPEAQPAADEADLHLPIPADGSQLRAITMAQLGRSFVLEGPPGTGKSQTITNLIARSLASGQTVLFVAEKEAALDVVKRRLAQIGLAPFVLNLHGRKQSMNAIRQQLLEALGQVDCGDEAAWTAAETTYRTMLAPLAAYPERVHRPNAARLSVWSAYEELLATRDSPDADGAAGEGAVSGLLEEPIAPIPESYLDASEQRRVRVELALRELPLAARSAGLRQHHPWSCCGRTTIAGLEPEVVTGLAANLEAIRTRVEQRPVLVSLLRGLASPFELTGLLPAVHLAAKGALREAEGAPTRQTAVTQRDAAAGGEPAQWEVTPRWETAVAAIEADLGMFHQTYAAELRAFRPEIYDLPALGTWYEEAQDASARLFGRGRRLTALADRLTPYLRIAAPLDPDGVEHLLARLLAIRSHDVALSQRVRGLPGLRLPPGWRPLAPEAGTQFAEANQASMVIGKLQIEHPQARALLRGGVTASDADLLERLATGWASWSSCLQLGEVELRRWAGSDHWYDAWQRTGPQWLSDLRGQSLRAIQRWGAVLARAGALTEAGLGELRDLMLSGELPMPEAELAYRRGVAHTALTERLRTEGLEYFDPDAHDTRIDLFARAAEDLRAALVTRLPAILLRRRPFTAEDCSGRAASVVAELRRRRGGQSFRELFSTASDIILALTPCVLVSPASAATFLAPDAARFDLVVFDEASQIRVAESIGPMGRGRATIIVGDSQQMPPTTVMRASHAAEEDGGFSGVDELPEDADSILSEAVGAQLPQYWLSWHYRSCDEALIAFSNHHFYADRLSSLPSPDPTVGRAIGWHRVAGTFDRGGSRTNEVEARAVVAEIAQRLAGPATAEHSIGVVTFNIQQRNLILNLLEDSEDGNVRARMCPTATEPIFVKNLENVQGDERDVILFSLAFSTNPTTGQLPLNFGPLGQLGGERRLNVAITRARREVALFASFDPGDIDLSRTTAVGTQRLRQYCELAADTPRRLAELVASRDARPAGAEPGQRHRLRERGLIREEIAAAVRARGYEVVTGYGLSTFTVDLAVRAPGAAQWQVAIILDGPAWSQRRTTADRDLLPTLLTGGLGWPAMLRCWLPAWVGNREAFLERLTATVAQASATVP
ncbi:MAG: DUF4011 domain-containing protein [Dactylosporangium sp.]|nr:DUF4011 domain-containing protein [Dactylosporangium sp.]NNJ62951.1 DUF4011 domain-containing protein [Dactylosporangium sp.]